MDEINELMAKQYESKKAACPFTAEMVFSTLCNLENLNRMRDKIPQDKVQELEVGADFIRIKVDGLSQMITFRIVDREEGRRICYAVENLPLEMNAEVLTEPTSAADCTIRVALNADIPMMFRLMLEPKLQTGLDQAADMLAAIPYNEWN